MRFIEAFTEAFNAAGDNLMGLITGILPTLACLLTFITAIIKLIGEERVEKLAAKVARYRLLRYTLLPFLGFFILTNPMSFTMGQFLPEKYKASFIDATCAIGHPMMGLFPHVAPAELFIYLGIVSGLQKLGLPTVRLAVYYLVIGLIVGFVRGLFTERMWMYYANKADISYRHSTEVLSPEET
ncbi:PTS glucitol/sorbitol transporter subunit IIC [Enterococcus gilvus]|uniref:PTS glucitol/sorbitol transporter subunit IIC n=1 Tax=Enterococcus gilvus TaxID=160453 RepID=UPI001C8BDE40|nr:PTS glucitol/sorbitol transporter subunit IIC [Enterococcus gilvus]MBX8935297.1 PTS sorbitol transporter subunit IIC [Enterococcus gilvus]